MSKIKQQTHISTAQKQLQKAKERSQKYVPGKINLQILGNGAEGTPSTVYLFTDQTRYSRQLHIFPIFVLKNTFLLLITALTFTIDTFLTVEKVLKGLHTSIKLN